MYIYIIPRPFWAVNEGLNRPAAHYLAPRRLYFGKTILAPKCWWTSKNQAKDEQGGVV
jgi:hypothetical protein